MAPAGGAVAGEGGRGYALDLAQSGINLIPGVTHVRYHQELYFGFSKLIINVFCSAEPTPDT